MKKVYDFVCKNKQEFINIAFIFVIFWWLFFVIREQVGSVIIDCGREAYFAQEVMKGKVLYKDLFNIFGPLSYQINAVFFKLFGVSLDVLRFAGAINALISVYLLYGISRLFNSPKIAFSNTCYLMLTCIFSFWVFSFILPYTFAMSYAFCALLCSLLFLLLFMKNQKPVFMPLSWLFMGMSLACKLDYISYFAVLSIVSLYFLITKKVGMKIALFSLLGFLIVPVASFSVLFLQGLTFTGLIEQFQLVHKYALSPSLNLFYFTTCGLYPNILNSVVCVYKFILIFSSVSLVIASFYLGMKYLQKGKNRAVNILFFILGTFTAAAGLFEGLRYEPFKNVCWLPQFILIVCGFILWQKFYKGKKVCDNAFLVFLIVAIAASAKTFFCLNLQSYGTFTFPLLFIAFGTLVVEYLPSYFKSIDKNLLEKAYFAVFMFICLYLSILSTQLIHFQSMVVGEKGIMYNKPSKATSVQQAINYIEESVKPNESIWVVPEGLMINFLTNRPSKSIYYNVTTPYIETFGEDKIVSDIRKDPPDYVIINSRNSYEYGYPYLCESYGFKICEYVKSEYDLDAAITGDEDFDDRFYKVFYINIYKKKKRQ